MTSFPQTSARVLTPLNLTGARAVERRYLPSSAPAHHIPQPPFSYFGTAVHPVQPVLQRVNTCRSGPVRKGQDFKIIFHSGSETEAAATVHLNKGSKVQ